MGRLALTALAFMLVLGASGAPQAEPAPSGVSELTIVPAGTAAKKAETGTPTPAHARETIQTGKAPAPEPEPSRASEAKTELAPPDGNETTEAKESATADDAQDADSPAEAAADDARDEPAGAEATVLVEREPETPAAEAIRAHLQKLPEDGEEYELNERAALIAFYGARAYAPVWVDGQGFNADADAVMEVLRTAGEWGLDADDFPLPALAAPEEDDGAERPPVELVRDAHTSSAQAEADVHLLQTVLKYARQARGGRIMAPSEQLNSNLDRRAQLIEPAEVLAGIAEASDKAQALLDTHPKHPQFHLLREKYVAALGEDRTATPNAAAKRLRANMEMWRWKWPDIGDLHLIANVPAYMIDVVKDGRTIHSERIVVGELGKQTSIFSRRLQDVTFRPMWRVPESIKVRELWPSLLRGGGMMRQYGLEVETKSGRRLDWRTMDWTNTDIRQYEVVQPPGPKSAMGLVKFSFPSQHTIFMHDTPDKWMFAQRQRTLSAGCLRLRNPLRIAEIVLEHDKGWDAEKVGQLARSGPLNNEVLIEGRIPMHIVYQTAWVDENDGTLKTYSDIYGHERRVTLALDGKWDQINKGRNHLAPHVPDRREVARAKSAPQQRATSPSSSTNNTFMSAFGNDF